MAPPQAPPPAACSAPGCESTTPPGVNDHATILQYMTLHVQTAHAAAPAGPAPPSVTAKIDKLSRPAAKRDMTEHEYKFFENEWTRYKRATNISGQLLIDELWNTMSPDLKQLAFDQGDVDNLNTEALMLARIKSLAVTVQHAAVHTVALHSAQQHNDESTKAFAARVRGIASNCNLSKKSGCACNIDVSYLEETVYPVVLAGLKD